LDDPVRQGMLALLQDAALTPGDNGPALKSDDTRAARTALDDWSAAGPARLRFAADFPGAAWSWVGGGDADRLRGAAAAYFAALPAGARVCGLPLAGPVRWDEQTHKGSASADLGRLGAKVPAEARNEFLTAQKRRLGPRIAAGLQPEEGGYTAVAGTAGTPPAGRLGDDEAYLLTRGRLPARPTLLALADAGRCSAGLAEYFRALFHGADLLPRGGLVPAKPYRGPASYLGAALRAEGDVLRVDLYLPADAVAAMRAVLEPLAADAGERP
jgi:hypothetical protein